MPVGSSVNLSTGIIKAVTTLTQVNNSQHYSYSYSNHHVTINSISENFEVGMQQCRGQRGWYDTAVHFVAESLSLRRSAGMPLIRLPNSHPGRTFLGKLTNKKKTAFIYFSSFSFEVLSCTGWAERSRCSDWTITQSVAGIRQKRKYKKKFSGVKSPYPKYKKSKMAENCAAWKAVFFHRSLTVSNCFLTPSLFREGYVSSSSERFSVQWDCEDPLRSTCVSGKSRLMCRARRTNCLKLKGSVAETFWEPRP